MQIAGKFSFAGGEEYITTRYQELLNEVSDAIQMIDASLKKTKTSREKTMKGRKLFSPRALNKDFKKILTPNGWASHKELCEYSRDYYLPHYKSATETKGAFRDMDFVKGKLGIEVQFGKYAFMVYNVCAKMTIFKNLGIIDAGIEIVPVKSLAEQMSAGVSYFEQFVWDLKHRGVSNIDVPVLILGIDV